MKLTKEVIDVLKFHGYMTVTAPAQDFIDRYDTVEELGNAGFIGDRGAIHLLESVFDENGVNRSAEVKDAELEKQAVEAPVENENPVEAPVEDEAAVEDDSLIEDSDGNGPDEIPITKTEENPKTDVEDVTEAKPEQEPVTESDGEQNPPADTPVTTTEPKKTTKKSTTKKKTTEKES